MSNFSEFASCQYDALPDWIRKMFTAKEWMWLGDDKYRALEQDCYPDRDVTE